MKADRRFEKFLITARFSGQRLPQFELAIARADNRRAMRAKASKKKRGK